MASLSPIPASSKDQTCIAPPKPGGDFRILQWHIGQKLAEVGSADSPTIRKNRDLAIADVDRCFLQSNAPSQSSRRAESRAIRSGSQAAQSLH